MFLGIRILIFTSKKIFAFSRPPWGSGRLILNIYKSNKPTYVPPCLLCEKIEILSQKNICKHILALLITRISLQLPLSKLKVDFWRLIIIFYVKIEILTPKKHIFKDMLVCYFYKLPGSASSCLQVSFKWPPVGQIWFLMWKLKSCTYQKKIFIDITFVNAQDQPPTL